MPSEFKISKAEGDAIPPEQWEFEGFSSDGARRYLIHWVDREKGIFIRKVENLYETEILERNKRLWNESDNQRFGDGRVVASIPLNVALEEFAPRLKQGDRDFTKWWLKQDANQPYRNFKKTI